MKWGIINIRRCTEIAGIRDWERRWSSRWESCRFDGVGGAGTWNAWDSVSSSQTHFLSPCSCANRDPENHSLAKTHFAMDYSGMEQLTKKGERLVWFESCIHYSGQSHGPARCWQNTAPNIPPIKPPELIKTQAISTARSPSRPQSPSSSAVSS